MAGIHQRGEERRIRARRSGREAAEAVSPSTGVSSVERSSPLLYMIYIIPGLGDKKYNFPKYVKYLHLSIDDVFNLPKLPRDSILVGFSIGAVIAYLISLKYPVKKLILCSPSPIIVKYKRPKGEIYVLSGNKETIQMQKYARALAKKLRGIFVKVNSRHKLTDAYIKAILKIAIASD